MEDTDLNKRIAELEAERDGYVLGAPDGTETPNPEGWAEDNPEDAAELAALVAERGETTVWLVIGWGSWGRDRWFSEAMSNWMKHAGRSATVCNIYRFTGEFDPTRVRVDDMGGISYPQVAKITKLEGFKVTPAMHEAYSAWSNVLSDIEYGDTAFTAVFDEDE